LQIVDSHFALTDWNKQLYEPYFMAPVRIPQVRGCGSVALDASLHTPLQSEPPGARFSVFQCRWRAA
jgi:hypothetical protein